MITIQDYVHRMRSFAGKTFISRDEGGTVTLIDFGQAAGIVDSYSKGFLELGLLPGDRVAVFSDNIPEWILIVLGINNAGLVDVPRGENSDEEEIRYIIEHSRSRLVIASDETMARKAAKYSHSQVLGLYTIKKANGLKHISEISGIGAKSDAKIPPVSGSSSCSIIYTSGSTGAPKGVELSHGNFTENAEACTRAIKINSADKFLSILPAWHAFERIIKLFALSQGCETFYSSPKNLLRDLKGQDPTILASVPRVWETIYGAVMRKAGEKGKLRKAVFDIGVKSIIDSGKKNKTLHPSKLIGQLVKPYFDSKVFSEIRAQLGGRFRYGVSGGSKLPAPIDDFFAAAGIELIEGYGLTETSPVLAVRRPGEAALYTVGPLLDNVSGRIIDHETGREMPAGCEGILYVKGPNIMKGYYRDYENTRKVLDSEGWLDTGDRGYFDPAGNLVITGREKDIVVLSNGENVNPVKIEERLAKSEFIESILITGHDWKHIGALIVPRFEKLNGWCLAAGVTYNEENLSLTLAEPRVRELFRQEIRKFINPKEGFKEYELVREFRLLPQSFMIGRELTATLKMKRRVIVELYSKYVENMGEKLNRGL